MNPRISNSMSVNQLANVPSDMQTYIPAMYQNGADCYESKGKKTSRIIKSVTSIFNSVLLTAGVAIGGFFGFKWLKSSNLSFMSKPLQKYDFKDIANTTSENIAGNDKQKEQLKQIIEDCKQNKNEDGTIKGCGVLLQGPPRCGKTMSAKVFAKESGLTTFTCKTSSIISTVRGQTEKNVDKMFDQLRKQVKKDGKPVILIMDEIDSFLMKRDNATNEERAMVNAFLRNCDELKKQGIIILGSTNYGDKCDKAATGSGRFDQSISFALPTKEELQTMLNKGTEINEKLPKNKTEKNILTIASFMAEHHMNWADAQNILNQFVDESGNIKFKEAMSYLIDTCKGNSTVQISSLIQKNPPGTKALAWEDIYGLEKQKEKLSNWANEPKTSSGYLLSGEPGCGKTTLPYALGKEIGSPVYTLRIGENGVTVDNVKSVIEDIKLEGLKRKVNEEKPLILFLDEAETMFPNRKGADLMPNVSNSYEKTGTAIDAIQNLRESGILCIAATNAPECVDGAMKREGRLNEMKIEMPTKNDVAQFIKDKYETLKDIADEIAGIFGNKNSKLSFANIKGILDEFVKTYNLGANYTEWKEELSKSVNEKAESMNATPTESGLTQIGKSLDEIKEAIKKLKDDGVSAQLAELTPYLKNLDNLNKLDCLEGMQKALKGLRDAIGVPGSDDNGAKHNLLNLVESLCVRLEGLKKLNQIEELAKAIKANTAQNGELIKSVNTIVDALKTTMDNINQIAENNTDLMKSYKELTGGVADSLNAVSVALKGNTNAIKTLNDTQDKLKGLLEKIKDLKGGGASDKILENIKEELARFGTNFSSFLNLYKKEKLLKALDANDSVIRRKIFKITDQKKYTGIDLFCAPYNWSSNKDLGSYCSFLIDIIRAGHICMYPNNTCIFEASFPNSSLFSFQDFLSKNKSLETIQTNIDKNLFIRKLNEHLKKLKTPADAKISAFEILVNNFNWESLISNNIDAFDKNSSYVIVNENQSSTPTINYSNDDEAVVINEAAIPVIKDAFNAILDIVINAWKGHDIGGSYISY